MLIAGMLALSLIGQVDNWSQEPVFAPRMIGTISLSAGGAYGAQLALPGLGIDGELGAQVAPRWMVSGFARLFGILVIMNGQVGVQATYLLGSRVGLGLGARVSQLQPLAGHLGSPSTSVLLPLRVLIALSQPLEDRRQGLVLTLEVAPGIQVGGTFYSGALFAGSASVGLGYGSW